jgi:ABC-type multidrug transport system ATPase subunit
MTVQALDLASPEDATAKKAEGAQGENAAPVPADGPSGGEDVAVPLDSGAPAAAKTGDGMTVTFTDLAYEVPTKKGKPPLVILPGLTGRLEPNRLTALMGPSGSGKTTLMDILAGRKSGKGTERGEILFGGTQVPRGALAHLCGYVEQFDTLVGELTVEQMLHYQAELKLPRKMGSAEKRQRCDEVIALLDLEKCRGTVIGNALNRGVSGGQAKRVNIALALITRPKVLFLDEPTSGLDSHMANGVVAAVRQLAREGRTVVATIHAPTSYAFTLFDDLFMLQSGGLAIYSGPVAGVRPHFEAVGFPFPKEPGYSLPDWLVDTTSGGALGSEGKDEKDASETDFAALWTNSEAAKAEKAMVESRLSALRGAPADVNSLPTTGPGQLHALKTLLAYRMVTHYKSGEYLGPRFGDKIMMALICMSLYWGIGEKEDAQSIQATASVLYFFTALCGYGAAAFVPSLTMERALFYRERADGCYTGVTYYLSKFIEEAVMAVMTSLVFSVVVFFSLSLQGSFVIFTLGYFLTTLLGIVLAYAVAAVAPNMEAANALLPTYVTTCMYFGGLFIMFDKIPVGWYWFSWTSFLRYAWAVLMLNQFQGQGTGDRPVFYDAGSGNYVTILEFYGMGEGDDVMNDCGACMGILLSILIFFGFLGALALTFISHIKR